ncbi:MAG: restriction system protein, partial [Mycobacterium sp.]|nr:restriction system protein [Mycobacterium sp.]
MSADDTPRRNGTLRTLGLRTLGLRALNLSVPGPTIRNVRKTYLFVAVAAGVATYVAGLGVPWIVAAAVLAPALPAFLLGILRGARTPAARED